MTLESEQQNVVLSVVIASGAGGEFLPRCLDSLQVQADSTDVEVIVVDRCGKEVIDRIGKQYPFVRLLRADIGNHRPSVPELRTQGVRAARGSIIAVVEEHCVVPPNWVETIRTSIQPGDAAIGGPVLDNNYTRLRDWVVYFSEYHNYLPPWPEGERATLNGANIAYPRAKLVQHLDVLGQGYWEVVLHPQLLREGHFRSIPEMGVRHTGPFGYIYYLNQRYLLSRVWGGTQRQSVTSGRRMRYLVTAPVLPLLLLARIALRVSHNKRYLRKFLLALPLLVPVTIAYVWGEWLGYLMGIGDALERVE